MKRAALFAAALGLAAAAPAHERILRFDAEIQVLPTGEIEVREEIQVEAEGDRIRHGIFRDLPTIYRDRGLPAPLSHLFPHNTPLKFLGAERDGHPEPWHVRLQEQGPRYYLGSKDVDVPAGPLRYTLRYRYDRILKRLNDHDELFWNVTGNDWAFPIEACSATLRLPADPGASLRLAAYTGRRGAQGQDFKAEDLGGGRVRFSSTRRLEPEEGLSVVLGWAPGLVAPPSALRRLAWALRDGAKALVACLAICVCGVVLLLLWARHGADPEPRALVPRFQPPRGLPPAALRHLDGRGVDPVCLSATLLHMAVQGRLHLAQGKKKAWVLTRRDGAAADGLELALDRSLFPGGRGSVDTAKESQHPLFRSADAAHDAALRADYRADVQENFKQQGKAWAVALAFIPLGVWSGAGPWVALLFGAGLLLLGAITGAFLASAWEALRPGRLGVLWGPFAGLSLGGLLSLAVSLALAVGLGLDGHLPWLALQALGCGYLLGAFVIWMPRPSEDLQRLRDEIAGFTHYLSIAEQDRLQRLHPPERTPQLFERYLPYALALGVANQWCQAFEAVLAKALLAGTYAPVWYSGTDFDHGIRGGGFSRFSDSLSSGFSSSVASASAPPPSDSGSSGFGGGGGGGSGGGGGGGGGGGW